MWWGITIITFVVCSGIAIYVIVKLFGEGKAAGLGNKPDGGSGDGGSGDGDPPAS